MATSPLPHHLMPGLRIFVLIALAVCPSCSSEPMRPAAHSRSSAQASSRPPLTTASPSPQLPTGDPRYRSSNGLSELRAVAGNVAKASGRRIHWDLKTGANPGSLIRISGNLDDCTIYVHPVAATKVPPNTWAFLIGHEFAHFTESTQDHSGTNPAIELKADILGARYAMAAGYRIEGFLGWAVTEPDRQTVSHGSLHQRVQAIAAHFGVPQAVIQEEARRAVRYRATH